MTREEIVRAVLDPCSVPDLERVRIGIESGGLAEIGAMVAVTIWGKSAAVLNPTIPTAMSYGMMIAFLYFKDQFEVKR